MVNRTALAALLLALAAPSWANEGIQDARRAADAGGASFDGGCTGGSCGAQVSPSDGRINDAVAGALNTGSLVVAQQAPRTAMSAEVPAPPLGLDKEGSKDKPGFFSKLLSGKGLMYGLGGAAAGAGIGWLVGGPIGAVVGGLLGAIGGFFLSKMLAK